MSLKEIVILLVDDNEQFARQIEELLKTDEQQKFAIIWKRNGEEAMNELAKNSSVDIIFMEYFLPGKNGIDVAREVRKIRTGIPIVFTTINKDFDLAVEAMKIGVDEYLVKDELLTPVLMKTIVAVLEKHHLREELAALEITQHRLDAMRKMVSEILKEIAEPIRKMEEGLQELGLSEHVGKQAKYVNIMKENIVRIGKKIEMLRSLNRDKTVPYIKNIRMIDLS